MAMPRKIKFDQIRRVANVIERDGALYNQKMWGSEADGYREMYFQAGVQCQSPACLAGHTVALIGNEEEFRTKFDGIISRYAQHLLNLPDSWADALFSASWPQQWITAMPNDTLTPTALSPDSSEEGYKNQTIPEATEAVKVLNHLANQFETEQRMREEKRNG